MQIFMSWMGENGWSGLYPWPSILPSCPIPSHSLNSSSSSPRLMCRRGRHSSGVREHRPQATSIMTTLSSFIGWSWSAGQRHSRGGQRKSRYPGDRGRYLKSSHKKLIGGSVFLQASPAQCGFGLGKVRSESPPVKLNKEHENVLNNYCLFACSLHTYLFPPAVHTMGRPALADAQALIAPPSPDLCS